MQKNKLPKIVHFQITSKCNNNCKHCFGPNKDTIDMTMTQIDKMIKILSNAGVENIHLTGGEPTLRKNFDQIIKKLKKSGFKIFMDTNCDYFFQHEKTISKNILVLGVPIDFPDKSWRNSENLDNVLSILNFYKNKKNKPKIRVLTTVTKENIKDIYKIGELLKKYKFDIWRIFQFLPLKNSNAGKNQIDLSITSNQFKFLKKDISSRFSKYYNINFVSVGQRDRAYFIINSNGKIVIPAEIGVPENQVAGNIWDTDIIEKWKKFGSDKNFKRSSQEIFDLIR